MNTLVKKFWFKAATWMVAEIVLNCIGLDNLADYSEYLFDCNVSLSGRHASIGFVVMMPSFGL